MIILHMGCVCDMLPPWRGSDQAEVALTHLRPQGTPCLSSVGHPARLYVWGELELPKRAWPGCSGRPDAVGCPVCPLPLDLTRTPGPAPAPPASPPRGTCRAMGRCPEGCHEVRPRAVPPVPSPHLPLPRTRPENSLPHPCPLCLGASDGLEAGPASRLCPRPGLAPGRGQAPPGQKPAPSCTPTFVPLSIRSQLPRRPRGGPGSVGRSRLVRTPPG